MRNIDSSNVDDILAPTTHSFTFPYGERFKSTLLQYDEVLQQCSQISHPMLEFRECLTIQIRKDVYAFKYGSPIKVSRITNLRDAVKIRKTPLKSANICRLYFALANYKNKMCYVTGGAAKD